MHEVTDPVSASREGFCAGKIQTRIRKDDLALYLDAPLHSISEISPRNDELT